MPMAIGVKMFGYKECGRRAFERLITKNVGLLNSGASRPFESIPAMEQIKEKQN